MKVLHFYKTYLPDTIGGAEQVIRQIAIEVKKFGVTSEVLSLSPENVDKTIELDGHLVHRCKSNFEIASTPFSASAFLRFKLLVKTADIIHYHYPYPFADLLHFLTQVNKPTVVSYHSDIIKQKHLLKLYRPLERYFLNSVDRIVVASPNYLKSSATLMDYKHKTTIIPYGLNKLNYPVPSSGKLKYWRSLFGARFFLFVGVLRYYKGLHILVEAARQSDYPIIIVGAGPIEKELKAQAANLGIKNIYFVGFVSEEDKVALYTLCYGIVFPSHLRSEAFGMSLLEGAMYGKPLISSEIGTGTTYVNIDGETGKVVPPSDPAALRAVMDYFWENPSVVSEMGYRAEKRYHDFFTADKMAKAYHNLYQDLLKTH